MATFRVGVGSFNIKDGSVGIGTEGTGHGNLRVEGTVKSTNIDVLGVSTFTRYSGFNADEVKVSNRDLTLSGEYSTTGDVVVESGASLTVGLGSTACIGTVESINVRNHFSVPSGNTAQRNESSGYSEGVIRYNSDIQTMEFFDGSEWKQFTCVADIEDDASVLYHISPSTSSRAVIYQGYQPSYYPDMIDFLQITTLGNTQSFGDQNGGAARDRHGCGSDTRGVFGGGISPGGGRFDAIEYVTLQSQGNGIDFGDLTQGEGHGTSCSSHTRGLFGGGYQPSLNNTVNFIQIQTLGDALDFGDLQLATGYGGSGASPTRAIFAGGSYNAPSDLPSDRTEFFTFATKGNGTDFGGLSVARFRPTGCGANLSVFSFGSMSGNTGQARGIDQTNAVSLGRSVSFGDLSIGDIISGFSSGNKTRVVMGGGQGGGTTPVFQQNRIDFITIATSGNSQDFGDMAMPTAFCNSTSDTHGGIGGY